MKHFRQLQANLIVQATLYLVSTSSFVWIFTMEILDSRSLGSLPFLILFSGMFVFGVYYFRLTTLKVIRLESMTGGYRATLITMKKIEFQAEEVKAILEGFDHIMLVLKNGTKLDFDKIDRYHFGARNFRPLENHPWVSFITKKRFHEASYQTKRSPW